MSELPRGIRLCNPMNLKEFKGDETHWVGERATDDDPVFEEFISFADGIRAGALILRNYARYHQINTLKDAIYRFAPPSDRNPTESYLSNVAGRTGIAALARIDLANDFATLLLICEAIILQEQGKPYYEWFDFKTLVRGVERAMKAG